jgi:biotin carboxylase
MLHSDDVVAEGFRPLQRVATEPRKMGSSSNNKESMQRHNSFIRDTGESTDEQSVWQSTTWSKFERARGRTMDRANSFVFATTQRTNSFIGDFMGSPLRSRSQSFITDVRDMIVVVDPFSTGAHLAAEVSRQGVKCARVFSIWDSPVAALIQQGVEVEYTATIQHDDRNEDQDRAINDTVAQIKALPYNILAVIPGAETGVELADSLSHRMGLRSNGEEGSLARRNKYLMGEKVRNAGVRAVKQKNAKTLEELHEFLDTLPQDQFKCVVKPVQSAGTDDVFLCNQKEEAITAFKRIVGKRNGLGLINESALVQEFLSGTEYVIDKVSRDGVHKIVGVWEYDKRAVNGANFVYFGMRSRPSDSQKSIEMIAYADKVLDALGILQGPSHMEIMYCADGPCLVEVGSRCQGGEGTWLNVAKECIGYTQVEVTIDVYLEGKLFSKLAKNKYPLLKHGRDVDLVNRYGGVVRNMAGEGRLMALPSYRTHAWEIKPGDYAPLTVDCFTRPGCVQLVHEDEIQVDKDFEMVHTIEEMGLIDYSIICPTPPIIGAVVVVDAFSSGANLAALVVEWGYKLVLVISEQDSPIASLISSGTNLAPTLVIQHDDKDMDQNRAIDNTLEEIKTCGAPIYAIIPGAETGVDLADRLSGRFRTRSNGEAGTEKRRNKYLMQEAVRDYGARAVAQRLCRNEADVSSFVDSLDSPLCVIKPNESAGSDSIFKCRTKEEAIAAFNHIHGHFNGLGQVNDGALVQEFLEGIEFVVDGVSRDGIYKVVGIWEYDKRSINDANFVYFGMHMRSGDGDREQSLIEYAEKVVKAVGICQGPSHMEIILTPTGPCLVEVGSRCHGGEGSWLPIARECVGYTQLEVTLNAHLRPDSFDNIPKYPTLKKFGTEAFMVTLKDVVGKSGKMLKDIPGLAVITGFPSFRRVEMITQPGNALVATIDCFTRPGSVQMVNSDKGQLTRDYEVIRQLEKDGLFSFT